MLCPTEPNCDADAVAPLDPAAPNVNVPVVATDDATEEAAPKANSDVGADVLWLCVGVPVDELAGAELALNVKVLAPA